MDCDVCRLRRVDESLYSRASRGHQHAWLEFFGSEAFFAKDIDDWNVSEKVRHLLKDLDDRF
jgi:hypothetical protein